VPFGICGYTSRSFIFTLPLKDSTEGEKREGRENFFREDKVQMSRNIFKRERVVMATGGSLGDLHPYIALALEMKERDLEPVIVTGEAYREKIEALGIEFHPMRPKFPGLDDPAIVEIIDRMMNPQRGAEYLFKELMMPALRDSYEDMHDAIKGASLFVTHPLALAGPTLAQHTAIPWVSTVLAPASLWSDYDPFVPPNAPWLHKVLHWGRPILPRLFKKLVAAMGDSWLGPLYEFRKELGLPKGASPLFEGQYSPQLNLGLFSSALMKPQRDWPANTVLTGFPFYDKRDNSSVDLKLLDFLYSGPAPIVFTLGSAAVHVAGNFFHESIEAAKLLNRRAILLIGHEKNRPEGPLPDGVAVFNYAPYGELLPRAAAVVHQGGVGTTGQSLRAGIPMLVMPYSYDQPDNAARVTRLGVARTIKRASYRAERVASELTELLENPAYSNAAEEVSEQVRAENGATRAVDLMVGLLRRTKSQAPSRTGSKAARTLELSAVA
jgi:rhamnosyltransferase subunit B